MDTLNERLQENILSILDYLKTLGTELEGATREQAPLVIKEFLAWYTYSSVFWIGFGVFIWLLAFTVFKVLRSYKSEEATTLATVLLVVGTMASIPVIATSTFDLIKVQVAPRLVLIEKVSELVNGKR